MQKIAIIDPNRELTHTIKPLLAANDAEVFDCLDLSDFQTLTSHGPFLLIIIQLAARLGEVSTLVSQIRETQHEGELVFLTEGLTPELCLQIMKAGAMDIIGLPRPTPELANLLVAAIEGANDRKIRRDAEIEQLSIDIENRQLMNWRTMYANKEVKQTEHLIHEMATTINSSGGYEWLDLLQTMVNTDGDENITIPGDVYKLVLESAGTQRKYFDFITFLSRLDKMSITKNEHGAVQFSVDIKNLLVKELEKICPLHERSFKIAFPEPETWIHGYVCQDLQLLERIFRELIINAIKYSPPKTDLMVGLDVDEQGAMPVLNIWIRNQPRQYHAKDANGANIVGIPHEYSELVFDLFYTIEPYPNRLAEEEWTDGAGLYIARKLLRRQGAWLSTSNGVDYTGLHTQPFIKFNISMPLHSKRDFGQCNPKCSPCTFMLMRNRAHHI